MDSQQSLVKLPGRVVSIEQSRAYLPTAAFFASEATRIIHQDTPQLLGGDGEEVCSIMPLDMLRTTQADVSLMDQGRCLKRVLAPFAAHFAGSHLVQLAVDQLHQPGRGILIPGAPV